MDLPVPEGQKKEMSFASHATMSKSFGTQRKTLTRVIALEKKVGVLEKSGITPELFENINQSILNINQNLLGIRDIIAEDIAVDKKIEQDQAKADQQRLDSKKKEGAEKFLELETEKELVKPVKEGTKSVKGVFQRFMDAMLALFGGWMIDKLGKAIEAWNEGDTDKLKEIAKNVTTALGVVGGIFLAQSALVGGISGAISGIATGILFNIPAAIAVIANPITWLAMAAIVASVAAFFLAKRYAKRWEDKSEEIMKREDLSLAEKETQKMLYSKEYEADVLMHGAGRFGEQGSNPGTELVVAWKVLDALYTKKQLETDTVLMTSLRAIKSLSDNKKDLSDEDKALLNNITNEYRKLAMIEEALAVTQNAMSQASNEGNEAEKQKHLENKKKLEIAFNQTKENLISLRNSTKNENLLKILQIAQEYSVEGLGELEAAEHKDLGRLDFMADILEESRFKKDQSQLKIGGWGDQGMFGDKDKYPTLDFSIEDDVYNKGKNFLNSDGKWEDLSSIEKNNDQLISQNTEKGPIIEVVPIETGSGNKKGNNSLVKSGANDKEITQLATSNGHDPYDLFYNSVYNLG
jgi:membrane protein implicated in regulation of membrane protease activity